MTEPLLHTREVGTGQPIIVLHGGPDFDHDYLLPDLDRLADLGRLIYYDQRGRGRSSSGVRAEDVTIESEMADLDQVRVRSGSASVALLGHSWGALLALEYAIRHPDRVSHLILLNPAPASHDDFLALRDHLAALRTPAEIARRAELRADPIFLAGDLAAEAEYNRIHFRSAVHNPEHLDAVVARLRRTVDARGVVLSRAIEDRLYEQTWVEPSYDLLPRIRSLAIPTLVLHGDHDFIPLALARHIADAIPGARLVVVPECGHFSFLEQPDAVHEAIAQLL